MRAIVAALVAIALPAPVRPAGSAVTDTTITTVAGTGVEGFAGDGGPATAALLRSPTGIVADAGGGFLLADGRNHRIRRVLADGTIVTFAGTGTPASTGDGGPATAATLFSPSAVAIGGTGAVYLTEGNRVRRIDPTGTIATVAGGGAGPGLGDGGPAAAARLGAPKGLAIAAAEVLFVADTENDRVRRVEANGQISTVAGGGAGPGLGDGGPATSATLRKPKGLALGADGSLYVADTGNLRIRRVAPSGQITTVAGGGTASGEGIPATGAALSLGGILDTPGLAVDPNGDLLVADSGQHRVRVVRPDGRMFTVAGTGEDGTTGDGGPAVTATLRSPAGLAVASTGVVLIADSSGNRVRRVQAPPLAIDDVRVLEGSSGVTQAVFTVSTSAHDQPFTADFATADGLATAAEGDYAATAGTLTFGPGELRKFVTVPVNGDTAPELEETFELRLSRSPYPDMRGTATIVNDDGSVPSLSVASTSSLEGDPLVFTVSKTGATSRTVSVRYTTADGSARETTDYTGQSGVLSIGPSETTKTVIVAVVADEDNEADETVLFRLSAPVDAQLDSTGGTGTGTILDDEGSRWTPTGALDACDTDAGCTPRESHAAISLDGPRCQSVNPPRWCGKVLVAGGMNQQFRRVCDVGGACGIQFLGRDSYASAALYDPFSGAWSPTGSMNDTRWDRQTAVLLADGRVLVAFGRGNADFLDDAEIYDPDTGSWTLTSQAGRARNYHTVIGLADGTVLSAGGAHRELNLPPITDVQLYDPAANAWRQCTAATATRGCPAPLPEARHHMAAARLPDGRILMTGGQGPNPNFPDGNDNGDAPLPVERSAFVFDPATGLWSQTTDMLVRRQEPEAFALTTEPCGSSCGKVLVVGGDRQGTPSAELYNPATQRWTFVPPPAFDGDSIALPDGTILMTDRSTGAAQLYDPVANVWRFTHSVEAYGAYTTSVLDSAACRHPDPPTFCGTVLVAGGVEDTDRQGIGEKDTTIGRSWLYTPAPAVRALGPASGPSAAGNQVVLTGTGLAGTTSVRFGAIRASDFRVDSSTQITARAPSQPSGPVEVAVRTTFGGTSAKSPPDLSHPYSYLVSQAPSPVLDPKAAATGNTGVSLSWSAVASDGGYPPPAARYVVKISLDPIVDAATFNAAPALCGGTCAFLPGTVGAGLRLSVDQLGAGTTYHFALRAVNEIGMSGPISNDVMVVTSGQGPPAPVVPDAVADVAPGSSKAAPDVASAASAIGQPERQPLRQSSIPQSSVPRAPAAPSTIVPVPTVAPSTAEPETARPFASTRPVEHPAEGEGRWPWVALGALVFFGLALAGAAVHRWAYPLPPADKRRRANP